MLRFYGKTNHTNGALYIFTLLVSAGTIYHLKCLRPLRSLLGEHRNLETKRMFFVKINKYVYRQKKKSNVLDYILL
jgi:hypothetical protein